jgi:hypothetical protein
LGLASLIEVRLQFFLQIGRRDSKGGCEQTEQYIPNHCPHYKISSIRDGRDGPTTLCGHSKVCPLKECRAAGLPRRITHAAND